MNSVFKRSGRSWDLMEQSVFLRQLEKREGDYSVDRDQWLSAPDVETLANQIREAREENRDGE